MNEFEALGRKQLALDNLNAEYDKLLLLVQELITGATKPDQVEVDLAGRSWKKTAIDASNKEFNDEAGIKMEPESDPEILALKEECKSIRKKIPSSRGEARASLLCREADIEAKIHARRMEREKDLEDSMNERIEKLG